MNQRQRKRRLAVRRSHGSRAAFRLYVALLAAEEKAKRQRKGRMGVVREMMRSGYVPDGEGGWRRLSKERRSGGN